MKLLLILLKNLFRNKQCKIEFPKLLCKLICISSSNVFKISIEIS